MRAADLNQRVTLQQATLSRDAVGGPVETWVDLATVWAAIYDLTGKAINDAQQAGSAVTRRVTVRWRSDVTSAMRVKFADTRVAKIAFTREVGRRDALELHCELIDG